MKKSNAKSKLRTQRKPAASGERSPSPSEAKELESRLAKIARAFADDRRVTSGGRGFGSGALKVNGKIFALVSSRGLFVLKLPSARVSELVAAGRGSCFDAGKGKPMKEWLALAAEERAWLALAKEAHAFALGAERAR